MRLAVIVDERDHGLGRGSSSAWVVDALALRSSRFLRSSAFSRANRSLVGPARRPTCRSSRRTQRRSVTAIQPTVAPIDLIADHLQQVVRRVLHNQANRPSLSFRRIAR